MTFQSITCMQCILNLATRFRVAAKKPYRAFSRGFIKRSERVHIISVTRNVVRRHRPYSLDHSVIFPIFRKVVLFVYILIR
jgi:hypothetical protein